MGSFRVQILVAVTFIQCFLWCDSYKATSYQVTVESFERESRVKRFFKSDWDENAQAFKVSFTGRNEESGTKFIFRSEWTSSNNKKSMQFTLRPAGSPDYILAVEGGRLVTKNLSKVDPVESKYKFEISTVTLQYRDAKRNVNVAEHYKILRTRSRPLRILKSSKSGKVSLDKWKTWKDCQAWFKLQIIP